jgi:Icc protein
MKLAWLTDPHLNFAGIQKVSGLMASVRAQSPDALLISGDIGEAPDLEGWLQQIGWEAKCPVYFVLGNHDFYHSSVAEVRAHVSVLSEHNAALCWLGEGGVIALSDHTALIGHDGWGDARLGDALHSRVMLADFDCIHDLRSASKPELIARLQALGDEAARVIREALTQALSSHRHVIVLTHVPPFAEACWHDGHHSDEEWLPYFSCHAVGEVLRELMGAHPEHTAHVLCGHTHSGGDAQILPNLRVTTGAATYRRPQLQHPLWVL